MKFFARGKRGTLYKEGDVVIKKGGAYTVNNEAFWLKRLNQYDIGPKFISNGEDFVSYKFVEGLEILDYFEQRGEKRIIKVIKNTLKQCRILDKLKVNKKEMHHPVKHILVNEIKNVKVIMIDFERCKITKNPKNVTQFCQFLVSRNVRFLLKKKGIFFDSSVIRKLLVNYKNEQSSVNFNKILRQFH